jgi:DNA mismatch repair ATPase MutS
MATAFIPMPLTNGLTAAIMPETLLKHFGVKSLKGFGIDKLNLGIIAAGVALHYLNETEHRNLQHISAISRIEEDSIPVAG